MPPLSNPASKTKAFKPPRPSGSSSKSTTKPTFQPAISTPSTSKKRGRPSKTRTPSPSPSPSNSDLDSDLTSPQPQPQSRSRAQQQRTTSPMPTHQQQQQYLQSDEQRPPVIPDKLLQVLLKNSFEDQESTGIGSDARKLVGKYMETFVREAIVRAVVERREGGGGGGGGGGVGVRGMVGGEDLQVEDLEKLAPQLILDF